MLMTKRKPATTGEILVEEFMKPIGLTQGALADAMGVQRKHVNALCNDRRNVTGDSSHSRPRIRQQPRFLAQCAAADRSMGSDAFTASAQTDRARTTSDKSGMSWAVWAGKIIFLICPSGGPIGSSCSGASGGLWSCRRCSCGER
jgi:hypothetical protein